MPSIEVLIVIGMLLLLVLGVDSSSPTASGDRPTAQRGDGRTTDGRKESADCG